jgi:hypothetical protein
VSEKRSEIVTSATRFRRAELDTHACRNLAARCLLDTRYAELVVDEAQDCSTADLYILNQLHTPACP